MPQEKRDAPDSGAPNGSSSCPTQPSRKRVQLSSAAAASPAESLQADPCSAATLHPNTNPPASPPSLHAAPTSAAHSPHGIPPKAFYGATSFIAPALHGGRGRLSALRASRNDPSRTFRVFATQQLCMDFCDARSGLGLRVWSFEVDGCGRRRYVAASYESFWRRYAGFLRRGVQTHFYEVIREGYASKLYFDLEFLRGHNPQARAEDMVEAVVQVCAEVCGREVRRRNGDVVELDSTTERKFSRHLVFEGLVFWDNVQAGDVARRVVEKIAERDEALVMVWDKDGGRVPFVDLGVYTRNRCFRLVGSSKFGKTQQLAEVGKGQSEGRLAVGKRMFMRSLVCAVDGGVALLGSPRAAGGGREAGERKGGVREHGGFQRASGERSEFPAVDAYVEQLVGGHGGGIYGVTVVSGADVVMYAIKGGYKFCARIGRHHRSNNVILVADVRKGEMHQRCFDPDCRGFRSAPWRLPPDVGGFLDAEVSDECLNEMMARVEGRGEAGGFDGGVADEELNRLMDAVYGKGGADGGGDGDDCGA